MQMLPKSAQLLEWIEQHEKGFLEGTMEYWVAYRIATCLEENLEDAQGIISAVSQLSKTKAPQGKQTLRFLSANVTSHRREIQTWISEQRPDAFALQELHLLGEQCTEAQINYDRDKWCTQVVPAFNTGKGTSGGVMIGARRHINMRQGPKFSLEGKGFHFGIFQGHDLAIGTVYLESGTGLEGEINSKILAELLVVIQAFSCKWFVSGDWNLTWEDLQDSTFPRLSRAGVVLPDQPTTTHGRTLDYALCSRELVGLVVATTTWDVPFRPHAAVLYQVEIGGLGTPVLRGPTFDKTWLEGTACADGEQGRAWHLVGETKPLVAPSSPAYPWLGRKRSYWGRLQLWVAQAADGRLSPKVIPALLSHLQQEDQDVEVEGVDVPALRAELAGILRRRQVVTSIMTVRRWLTGNDRDPCQGQARWPLYEKWAEAYVPRAPWDGARKGLASLDIALARLVRGEIQHHLRRQGVTLLLDLREFYEHVGLYQLIKEAQKHAFPPLILHHCIALYTHSRYICTEDTLAAPVQPTRGIIAGCPFAPGLSKLVMHPVMEPIHANPSLGHCDLYSDDSSFDVEGNSVTEVVHKSLEVWRHVKQAFLAQRLPISTDKSAWVCSSRAMEKKLAAQLGPENPKIQSCWRDLGVDSAGGKRRRVTIHRQRFSKAASRSKKLSQLATAGPARSKAARAGVESAATYGHQAVGLAPKRYLRQLTAAHNGGMTNGATEIVLDYRTETKPDPSALLVAQPLRSYVSVIARWPEALAVMLSTAFGGMCSKVEAHKEPWRIASGPIGATLCYLKDMGWKPLEPATWQIGDTRYHLTDPVQLEEVTRQVHYHWRLLRHDSISKLEAGEALQQGIDWTVGRKLLKKLPKLQSKALLAVWQGALRCGSKAWCSGCDTSLAGAPLVAVPVVEGSGVFHHAVLQAQRPREPFLTGLWATGQVLNDPELRYATDGSPGSTGDPRVWKMTWAAIAYKVQGDKITVVATAAGPVSGEQTVFRAEASALLFLVQHTAGDVDVTMDAKGVKTRVERWSLGKTSLDLFIPIREHGDRLRLHWIRSHQSLEQHCQEFGSLQPWRWFANAEVDKLAGDQANQARDPALEANLARSDADTKVVQRFLAERVALLFSYDKDQGPQVLFEGEMASVPKQSRPAGFSRKTIRKNKQRSEPVSSKETGDGPNKRDLLRDAVSNPPSGLGPLNTKAGLGLSVPDACSVYSKLISATKLKGSWPNRVWGTRA
ncbi:unnamed protein product, partial [Symbiodinium sp. CCMP2456]